MKVLIDETIVKEFAELLLEISKETAIKAHDYILMNVSAHY